jgi:hypothetical protein
MLVTLIIMMYRHHYQVRVVLSIHSQQVQTASGLVLKLNPNFKIFA